MHILDHASPNHDSRGGAPVDMLVLHYTGMPTAEAALARLCDPTQSHRVSAHYLVDEAGRVHRLVEESGRAWHAGVSSWRGHANVNARSVGIEIANSGHDGGLPPFPDAQMASVAALCREILARHPIPAWNVAAHSDVAPTRKMDPGERFDWQWLGGQGVGIWPTGMTVDGGRMTKKNRSSVIRHPSSDLHRYGYDITNLPAAIAAFQRHFRPRLLSGEWDGECAGILAALLEAAPSVI